LSYELSPSGKSGGVVLYLKFMNNSIELALNMYKNINPRSLKGENLVFFKALGQALKQIKYTHDESRTDKHTGGGT